MLLPGCGGSSGGRGPVTLNFWAYNEPGGTFRAAAETCSKENAGRYGWPMARVQTMVQLSEELVAELDTEAARRKTSRSGLIRDILDEYLRAHAEARIGARIVEGYRRLPPAQPDEWGDPAEIVDHAPVDLLHRLDAEPRGS